MCLKQIIRAFELFRARNLSKIENYPRLIFMNLCFSLYVISGVAGGVVVVVFIAGGVLIWICI